MNLLNIALNFDLDSLKIVIFNLAFPILCSFDLSLNAYKISYYSLSYGTEVL
jgi:hypothetical protein